MPRRKVGHDIFQTMSANPEALILSWVHRNSAESTQRMDQTLGTDLSVDSQATSCGLLPNDPSFSRRRSTKDLDCCLMAILSLTILRTLWSKRRERAQGNEEEQGEDSSHPYVN